MVQYLQDCIASSAMMITILLKNKRIVLKKINYLCYIMCFDYFLYVVYIYLGNKYILTK